MKNETTPAVQTLAPDDKGIRTLEVLKDRLIDAPIDIVWDSILEEMGPASIGRGSARLLPVTVQTNRPLGPRWTAPEGTTTACCGC